MINTCIKYLENSVRLHPHKTAIIDGDERITFLELKSNALKISSLIDSDFYNQPIAVFLPKSISAIECFLASLYSGNFYTPIDVKSPIERLKTICDNLKPKIIFTNSNFIEVLRENLPNNINVVDVDKIVPNFDIDYNKKLNTTIDTDPIYCIYTSGSTGIPKGVLIPHRGVYDYIEWAATCFNINDNDIISSQAPFHFDNSTLDIFLMLKTAATLVLIKEYLFSFPHKLIEEVENYKTTTIFWVPSVMNMVMNTDALKGKKTSLKKILFAGEVMPVKVLNYWKQHISDALYSNLYGPTEITVDCTYYIVNREFEETESLPIGYACLNTNVLLINEKNQVCEENELGELCVRGSSLALGYINNLEKTNESFVQNPLNNSYPEKIYRTGDLVKRNERNEIIYIGRKDSQIKHSGYRIELGEIENASNSLADISSSCVIYDEHNKEICLYYETKTKELTKNEIVKFLSRIIPKYMIPTKLERLDRMPLNSNGKIDRVLLRKIYNQ